MYVMFLSIICWTWIFICQLCKWFEGFKKQVEMAHGKNCILKGTVDFYCLVCETYLRSEADCIDHIARPIHKKNLDITQYVKHLEEDFIRKIKQGYFCELCNKLLPMMARVKIHVNELSHIDSKKRSCFKRIGINVIAFGKVVLDEKAWNGLNDESCAFCNTEYENEEIHKNLKTHITNIIQIKVEFDENKNIYRKIDDTSFQCLTCNMVVAFNEMSSHFKCDQHKHRYQKCIIAFDKIRKNESLATEDLKKINVNNEIEDLADKAVNNCLAKTFNEIEVNKELVRPKGVDVKTKLDMDETKAIESAPFNLTGENEKKFKASIGSTVKQELKNLKDNSEDSVINTSNKTAENKAEVLRDSGVKTINKNLEDLRLKKSKQKQKLPELNEIKKLGTSNLINKTSRRKSSFNIEEYERKIRKILKADDYITLDENGKTLCILCDWIMNPNNKKIHIASQHHQIMEKMHKKRLAEMGDTYNNEDTVQTTVQNENIIDLISKFQASNININLISNTAACTKCTVSLPYDVNAIEEHILKHNTEIFKQENKETLQSCEPKNEICLNVNETTIKDNNNESNALENQNEELECGKDKNVNQPKSKQSHVTVYKTLNTDKEKELKNLNDEKPDSVKETNEYDQLSNQGLVKVEETINTNEGNELNNLKEDKFESIEDKNEYKSTKKQGLVIADEKTSINETSLKDETEKLINQPSECSVLPKQSFSSYINSLTGIKYKIFNDVIINEKVCISIISFHYLLPLNGEINCSICDVEVNDIECHTNTFKHIKLLNETLVINEKAEFVREIRPELLHCGFCNIIVSSSKILEHLQSSLHLEIRNASEWRLQIYLDKMNTKNYNVTFPDSEFLIRNMFSGLF